MALINHHIEIGLVAIGLVSILSCTEYKQLVRRKSPTNHYREMNCTPLPNARNIQAYDCIFTKLKEPSRQCVYKNKLYNIGEETPERSGCSPYCECSANDNTSTILSCMFVDCAEYNRSCIHQYNLKDCCSKNMVCDPREIAKLSECVVDDTVYLEGQRFDPKGTCKTCVCGKGFTGNLVAPFCEDIECDLEIRNSDDIQNRCAPIYMDGNNTNCCPIDWECHNSPTIIEVGKKSKYKCQFGEKILNIGDKAITSNRCLTCSCDYPPLVTCIKQSSCTQ